MYKKISIIMLVILISIFIIPNPISSYSINENNNQRTFRDIFAATPLILIEPEHTDELAIPNGVILDIPLTITYELTGVFANQQERRIRGQNIQIQLSIINTPDWCAASLTPQILVVKIGDDEPLNAILAVSVNEDAPAFQEGVVKIKAETPEIQGFIFTRVLEQVYEFDIPFAVGYFPLLSVEKENTYFEIPPLNTTKIPIAIENFGNGPTMVNIEILDIPNNWIINYPKNITFGSHVAGLNYKKEIEISVKSSKDFSVKSIRINFTPSYVGRPDLKGDITTISYTFKNDGSLKEDNGFLINIAIFLGVIALIIVIFIVIYKTIKKKQ